jgi:hypothetical protein
MSLQQIPPDDIPLHFMLNTSPSYTDIPMDNYLFSMDEISFICDVIVNDAENTPNEDADFLAQLSVATGSDITNIMSHHSKPVVIPLLQ